MKSYFDFRDYIRQIQELPFVDEKCINLDVAFLFYQAGVSNNDSKILKKSFYLINYNHQAYYYQKMKIEELEQLYNNYINGNQNIDQEVPDVALEFNSGFLEFNTSFKEQKNKNLDNQVTQKAQNQKLEKEEQDIKLKQESNNKKNKQRIIIKEVQNIEQINQQERPTGVDRIDQKQNKDIIDVNNQNHFQLMDIHIPNIQAIYQLSVEQSQQMKKQQYEEYRKQEQFKSIQFQQKNERGQVLQITKCIICLENISSNKYLLTACQHIYHKQCLNNLIEAQVDLPIRCPNLECRQEILRDDLELITTKTVMDKLDKFAFNQYLMSHPNIFQCPTKNCQGIYEIEGPIQVCMICQQIFCTRCKKQFHEGICGEQSFVNLARKQQYKQCSHCNRWIEKIFGCNHISCPCGHEFCYECGKKWVKGMECRCIDFQQNQQQQQQVIQQQQIQHNQSNFYNIQTNSKQLGNLINTLFKTNENQVQNVQNDDMFKKFGLTYIKRIQRR